MLVGKMIRSQRGMTLVELLAIFVILGIIVSISVPTIYSLIERTREDAFVANALMMQEAAKLYVGLDQTLNETVTLKKLSEDGYIIGIIDPFSRTNINLDDSFVRIENGIDFYICLKGTSKQICGDDGLLVTEISRASVVPKP
jgi:type II secretory pathway pseudopilin PulG